MTNSLLDLPGSSTYREPAVRQWTLSGLPAGTQPIYYKDVVANRTPGIIAKPASTDSATISIAEMEAAEIREGVYGGLFCVAGVILTLAIHVALGKATVSDALLIFFVGPVFFFAFIVMIMFFETIGIFGIVLMIAIINGLIFKNRKVGAAANLTLFGLLFRKK